CAWSRRERVRRADVGEWNWRVDRSTRCCDIRTSVYTATTCAQRRLVIFERTVRVFFEPKFLSRAHISPGCRIWHAPVFLDLQHCAANDCAGGNPWPCHGGVVTGVRGDDSAWQPRSRRRCALAG